MSEFESIIDCEPMQQSDTVSGYDNKTTFEETNRNNEQEDTSPLDTLSNSNTAADSDDQHSDASFSINESHNIEVEDNLPDTETPPIQPCHVLLDSNVMASLPSKVTPSSDNTTTNYQGIQQHNESMNLNQVTTDVKLRKKEARFQCKHCSLWYTGSYGLRRHMARAHNTEPICKYCRRVFKIQVQLDEHVVSCKIKQRKELSKVTIPVVSKSNISKSQKSNKLPVNSPNNTIMCKTEKFTECVSSILNQPIINIGSLYACPICQELLPLRSELKAHLNEIHNFNLYCETCHKTFYSKLDFERHICPENNIVVNESSQLAKTLLTKPVVTDFDVNATKNKGTNSGSDIVSINNILTRSVSFPNTSIESKFLPLVKKDEHKLYNSMGLSVSPMEYKNFNFYHPIFKKYFVEEDENKESIIKLDINEEDSKLFENKNNIKTSLNNLKLLENKSCFNCLKCKNNFHNNEICFRLLCCLYSFKNVCEYCDVSFDCIFTLHCHVTSHNQPCALCLKQFNCSESLRCHMASTHQLEPVCTKCFSLFDTYEELNGHKTNC